MKGVARRLRAVVVTRELGSELAVAGGLLLLVAAFNPGLSFEGRVLGGYDAFVYFYPLRSYVAETLGHGQLPLWNPYLFAGSPYLANPQTAVFYPGTWLFAVMDTPRAYALNFLTHLWIVALGLYAFARVSLGLGRLAGVVGAAGFAFSGFMNGQAGHVNQFSVAAWLPAVALALDLALRTGRPLALAGLILGLTLQIVAGHPQEVYMTAVVLGIVVLWRAGSQVGGVGSLQSRVGVLVRGGVAVAVGGGLAGGICAVQLLPTLELSALSIRGGGLDYQLASFDALPWPLLLPALFPGYWSHLPTTEFFGHLGTALFALAWLGLLGGAGRSAALGAALVALGLLLAVGDATSAYRFLFDWAPGFASFRVPARWLLVSTFGLALLAAVGVDWLARACVERGLTVRQLVARIGSARLVLVGLLVPLGLASLVVLGQPQSKWLLLVWGTLTGATVALAAAVLLKLALARAALAVLVVGALGDLWIAGMNLEHRQPVPNVAFRQPRETTAELRSRAAGAPGFRSLSIATPEYVVRETGEYERRYGYLSRLSLENLLVTVKWNETLWPNVPLEYRLRSADGYDGGVLPLRTYYQFSQSMLGAAQARPDGVLASRLDAAPEPRWLDLLAVRWLVTSRVKDDSRGAVYYDRGITATLEPGESLVLSSLPLGEFTKLGMISSTSHRPGPATPTSRRGPATGETVGTLRLTAESGDVTELPLTLGRQTAPQTWSQEQAPDLERVQSWSVRDPAGPADWLTEIEFPRQSVVSMTIANTSADSILDVRSLNLIDDGRQMAFPITPDSRVERTDFFDLKLYDRQNALPRAHLVDRVHVLDDTRAAARLAEPTFDPHGEAVLAPSATAAELDGISLPGSVVLEIDEPERVRLAVHAPSDSYLILSDSWYPGWVATIDGSVAPVERANILFRAVRLSCGDHVVEFQYQPRSVFVGAAISAASVLAMVVVLSGLTFWRRRRSAHSAA